MKDLTSLQKLPKRVVDLGKIIVDTGFEKLPKVQYIAQSGHTAQVSISLFLMVKTFLSDCLEQCDQIGGLC